MFMILGLSYHSQSMCFVYVSIYISPYIIYLGSTVSFGPKNDDETWRQVEVFLGVLESDFTYAWSVVTTIISFNAQVLQVLKPFKEGKERKKKMLMVTVSVFASLFHDA